MLEVSIRSAAIAAVVAVTLAFGAGVVEAAPVTYNYVGNNFNFCGFGCPENLPPGVTVTPGQGEEVDISDHVVASLTFADALPFDPLDPNRVYAQSELPAVLLKRIDSHHGVLNVATLDRLAVEDQGVKGQ